MNPTLKKALDDQLERLPMEEQRKVLEFARSLGSSPVRGVPGVSLMRFAGTIEPDDLAVMSEAIDEGCEKVNPDEW